MRTAGWINAFASQRPINFCRPLLNSFPAQQTIGLPARLQSTMQLWRASYWLLNVQRSWFDKSSLNASAAAAAVTARSMMANSPVRTDDGNAQRVAANFHPTNQVHLQQINLMRWLQDKHKPAGLITVQTFKNSCN